METGIFKIAEQVDDCGFYGEILLQCALNENHLVQIEIPAHHSKWERGIGLGVTYFVESMRKKMGITVRIMEIKYNDVDTKQILIAYITFFALCDAFSLTPTNAPFFSKETKSFNFPLRATF